MTQRQDPTEHRLEESPGALPGLRAGAPGRLPAHPPVLDLSTDAARDRAVDDLITGFYAESSGPAVRARRSCYTRLLALWGLRPWPLTAHAIVCLAAGLKARRYRSASNVLSQFKVDAERLGQEVSAAQRRLLTDAVRSCRRGLGPATRAKALDFVRLGELRQSPEPWTPGGPLGPAAAMVIGAWWLMREVEAATVRAAHVTLSEVRGRLSAEIRLPVTKADQQALGVARSHACTCPPDHRRSDCPAHAVAEQMLLLRRAFPSRFGPDGPDLSLPLFPQRSGAPVSKACFAATICAAAVQLGTELRSSDGTERVSGHSLRVTGAQGLASLGVDTYAIQLLGRWGSSTVQHYVRSAAVSAAASSARAAATRISLDALTQRAAADGMVAGACTEESVRQMLCRILPGALAEARRSIAQELASEIDRRLAKSPRRASTSSSSDTSSTSRSGSPPAVPTAPDAGGDASAATAAPTPAVPPLRPNLSAGGGPGSSGQPTQVSNSLRKRRHLIVCGPPVLDPAAWVTACGWRFGRSDYAEPVNPAHDRCGVCLRKVGAGFP